MVSQKELQLLEHLKGLNLAQFEEVLFRLKIDPAIIPSSFAEQSIRAMRIIQRLKQEPEGLERLEKTLAEPAISIIGKQYTGYEIEAQVKQIVGEYIQQPFEGREAEKRQLDKFVRKNASGVLLVTGAAGFGKSALLSHWQQTQQEDYFIVYHCFSYRYEKTRSLAEAYRHLLKQLYLYYNIRNGELTNDENGMRDILVGMLREPISAKSKRLVIVLDGLDEADKTFEPFFTELPAGIFVIAAARNEEGEEPKYLRNWTDNAQRLYLKRLSRKAISKWLEQIKELVVYSQNKDFVKKLDKITDGFPLYLRFLLDDLKQAADVEQVLAQTPTGFEKYVEQQLERLDELDLPEQRWQFFALLAVAKGVLEKMEQAWEILERLQQKDLSHLSEYWMEDCAVYLLMRLLVVTKWKLTNLCKLILDDHGLAELSQNLAEEGEFAAAFDTAQQIDNSYEQSKVLAETRYLQSNQTPMILYQYRVFRSSRGEDVLTETAKAQAQAGNFIAALNTVQQIGDSYEQVKALIEIAKTQPTPENFAAILNTAQQIGDSYYVRIAVQYAPHRVQLNFIEALDAAQRNDFLSKRALVLTEIAKAQPTPENFSAALETAQQIDSSFFRALVLTEIAKAQPTSENFIAALETAQLIDDSDKQAEVLAEIAKVQTQALTEIAKAQAQAKNFTAALKTAQLIDSSYYRAEALTEIAKAQPTPENFTAAIKTAQLIDFSPYRAEALTEIAKAQAQAENFTAAVKTAQLINSSYYRALALTEIAKAQPIQENFTAAVKTAQLINSSYYRALALTEIAKAQPIQENFIAALKAAQQIDDSDKWALVLTEIAKAQIEAKLSKQALLTAEKISVNRNKHLPNIAAAFIKNNDKENFKRLLIPCAYYLDATYQMCGHLAKLYPEQATDIAKIVAKKFQVKPVSQEES